MKMTLKGMTTSAVKNFRMTISRSDRDRRARVPRHGTRASEPGTRALRAGFRRTAVAVQPLTHFLARLEERDALLIDRHMRAGAWIAPCACGTMLDGESAET